MIFAIVMAAATPVAIGIVAYTRRPPPPVTPHRVAVVIPTGASAQIEPQNRDAVRVTGEVVAALREPFRVVARGRQGTQDFYEAGAAPMLLIEFDPPLATTAGAARAILMSGLERSHRTAILYLAPDGEALVFLMPELRSRHWRVQRFARAGDAVFDIGLQRLRLTAAAAPPPPTPSVDGPPTPNDPGVTR